MDKQQEAGLSKEAQSDLGTEAQGDEDDYMPNISLDRYMSSRRRHKSNWIHLTTVIFMLAALVAVFLFKDQCGQSVSKTIFIQPQESSQKPLQIQRDPAKNTADPSADHK